jgi:hypothetical protein
MPSPWRLDVLTKQGFAEDEAMLEGIQAPAARPRGANAPEVSVRMDTAGVQARDRRAMDGEDA